MPYIKGQYWMITIILLCDNYFLVCNYYPNNLWTNVTVSFFGVILHNGIYLSNVVHVFYACITCLELLTGSLHYKVKNKVEIIHLPALANLVCMYIQ